MTNGAATYDRDKGAAPNGIVDEFLNIKTEVGENRIGERFNLKYDGIKNIVFFADTEMEQQMRNVNEKQDSFGTTATNSNNFGRDSDIIYYDYTYTTGIKWYPVSKADITVQFKYRYGLWDYDNESKTTNSGDVLRGYRGFLDDIAYTHYRPLLLFNVRPFKWLSGSFRYALDNTIYTVRTPKAEAPEPSPYTANIYTYSLTFTPSDSFNLSGYYQRKDASTKTQANGDGGPSGVNVPTYNANVHVVNASCSYSPDKKDTIILSYSLSKADNFDDFSELSLPLGLEHLTQDASLALERKINAHCSLELRHDFAQHYETFNNNIDDYLSHLFSTAVRMKF